jgi:release factor glutamine methyltransferase
MTSIGARLAAARGEERRDLEVLMCHVLGRSRAWLYAHGEARLDTADADRLDALAARRARGEPVAYLTGRREFWGLDLEVGPATLVPRPETELLVELCRAHVPPSGCVLDVGTGAGAIVLALARECPELTLTATDIDPAALAVARRNAERLDARVEFLVADLFEGLAGRRFDVVVSNPPYVAADDPHLEALAFEPRRALVGGKDGLDVLRRLIAGAPARLAPAGWLLVEHGADQGAAVRNLFAAAGLRDIHTQPDLAGHERATLGRR